MNIQAFWRAVITQNAEEMRRFLSPNAQIRWHCSNECFSAEEFIRANCEYPGEWDGEIERIEQMGETIITAVRVFARDGSLSCHAVSFIRLQGERIISIDEYWADDALPPQWRKEMGIGTKIRP